MRDWMREAAARYDSCNRATLRWMLDRAPVQDGFLDTKVNSLTGADYGPSDGTRGPAYTYGWIQGRGLEALATFAAHYGTSDAALAARLRDRTERLFVRLAALHARYGHTYFLHDQSGSPVRVAGRDVIPQTPAGAVHTFSDAFAAKGLIAASRLLEPTVRTRFPIYLDAVIAAIEDDRFQMDEKRPLTAANALAQPDDYGPRMILLGAAGLLHRVGLGDATAFADRFIDHVLARYADAASGLLLNVPGEDRCNVGHGIEFCGFAFEHLVERGADPRIGQLVEILVRSLEAGLQGPGIALFLSARTGQAVSPYYPWWPLPEAIRACALGLRLTGDARLPALWQRADAAFFANYWQPERGYAYQTRDPDGPVDYVPATPDLDPGYHTGLSLLAAINAIHAMAR